MTKKIEMTIVDVRAALAKMCQEAGGQRAFALQRGLTAQHVNSVLRGIKAPGPQLCRAMGIRDAGRRWVKA